MAERNYIEELKTAQASVKALGAKREGLIGDVASAKARYTQTVEQLTALGVENAATLSVDELKALKVASENELKKNLDTLNTKIAEAQGVVTEYEAAVK